MQLRTTTCLGAAAMILITAACADPPPGTAGPAVTTDSAGVAIVESPGASGSARIEFRAIASVGESEAPGDAQFGQVMDATLLPNGNLLVLDGQAHELVEVGRDGALVETWARGGEGPGELQFPRKMQWGPDGRLFVFERGALRASVFTASGEYVENRPGLESFPREAGTMFSQSCCVPVGVDASGATYWSTPEKWSVEGPGRRPVNAALVRFDPGDREGVVVGEYGAGEAAPWEGPNGVVGINFSPDVSFDVNEHGVHVGTGAFFGFERRSPDGTLQMVARAAIPRIAVTDERLADWQASERRRMGGRSEGGPDRLEQILTREHADSLPAFFDMKVDNQGWVWLTGLVGGEMGDRDELEFFVFDDAGHWVGYFRTGDLISIQHIEDEFAVGVRLDDLGRGIVEIYPVIREGGGGGE